MKHYDTVVATVVYEGLTDAMLKDFFSSMKQQTDMDYILYVVNDGYTGELKRFTDLPIVTEDVQGMRTVAEVRDLWFVFARNHCCIKLIFADADDYYGENRVSESKQMLSEHDFLFNELVLIDEFGNQIVDDYLQKLTLDLNSINIDTVLNKNVFGLTHTALRLDSFPEVHIPKDVVAVDWWIFSVLLAEGNKAAFMPNVKSYYRQYGANIVGIGSELNEKKLRRGIDVKKVHYQNMILYCTKQDKPELLEKYNKQLREIRELQRLVEASDSFADTYCAFVKNHHDEIYRGWWSDIQLFEEVKAYE